MRKFSWAVRFARKENKFYRRFADGVESAIVRPSLFGGNLAIDGAEENQGGCFDAIHLEERRLIDVELRIFERRLSEIIMVEGLAKIDVGPIAEPLNITRTDGGNFV